MTKRFKVYIDSNNLKSLWDDNGDGEPLLFLDREDAIQGVDEVCDLLNEQHEQIERLKRNFKALDEVKCELAEENEQLKKILGFLKNDNANDILNVLNSQENRIYELKQENEQLKQSIQEYKVILQDMGILMSDEDVVNIRNDIADKLLKPLFKSNGFDVDIDTTDGFTIIPKGDVE